MASGNASDLGSIAGLQYGETCGLDTRPVPIQVGSLRPACPIITASHRASHGKLPYREPGITPQVNASCTCRNLLRPEQAPWVRAFVEKGYSLRVVDLDRFGY